jgi:hypothetical protein
VGNDLPERAGGDEVRFEFAGKLTLAEQRRLSRYIHFSMFLRQAGKWSAAFFAAALLVGFMTPSFSWQRVSVVFAAYGVFLLVYALSLLIRHVRFVNTYRSEYDAKKDTIVQFSKARVAMRHGDGGEINLPAAKFVVRRTHLGLVCEGLKTGYVFFLLPWRVLGAEQADGIIALYRG